MHAFPHLIGMAHGFPFAAPCISFSNQGNMFVSSVSAAVNSNTTVNEASDNALLCIHLVMLMDAG